MRAARLVLVALLLAGSLAACTAISKEAKLIQACEQYDRVLLALTGFAAEGRLSPVQIASVDAVNVVARPICLEGDYVDVDAALAAVEGRLIEQLLAVQGEAQ